MVSLRIGILGTRGVPPRYGGFETFVGELSRRLVARGHSVTVYCRTDVGRASARRDGLKPVLHEPWHGVRRIVLPAIRHKYLETVSHTFLSALDALRRDFDVVLLCNAANAFVLPLLRAARLPVAINVDGIERRRRKWNILGRAVYAVGESFSALFASRVVADAAVIEAYYREVHGIEPVMIPYGAEFPEEEESDVVERLGLARGGYLLYVSRFEPENNPLEVVKAYERLSVVSSRFSDHRPPTTDNSVPPQLPDNREPTTDNSLPPLVMLGAAPYARELDAELRRHAGDRILFPGALYGRDYRTLQRNAMVYIQATEVGGTHPAMIEAMASGGCVVALDTAENREVGGEAVGYFRLRPNENLSGMLSECAGSPALRDQMRRAARTRAAALYSWERVTEAYEQLFAALTN
jgi:glycosyltransferase involved in cell wall biosynthesis